MKTFAIELRRTSYISLTIEAADAEAAEAEAWKRLESDCENINDAYWEVEFIEEQA